MIIGALSCSNKEPLHSLQMSDIYQKALRKAIPDFKEYDYIYISNLDICTSCAANIIQAFDRNYKCKNIVGVFVTRSSKNSKILEARFPNAAVSIIKYIDESILSSGLYKHGNLLYRQNKSNEFYQIDSRHIMEIINNCDD